MIHMSEATYRDLRDSYSGICRACWSVAHGSTEPDARGYLCEECGRERVFGIDEFLISGALNIDNTVNGPFVRLKSRKTGEIYSKEISL